MPEVSYKTLHGSVITAPVLFNNLSFQLLTGAAFLIEDLERRFAADSEGQLAGFCVVSVPLTGGGELFYTNAPRDMQITFPETQPQVVQDASATPIAVTPVDDVAAEVCPDCGELYDDHDDDDDHDDVDDGDLDNVLQASIFQALTQFEAAGGVLTPAAVMDLLVDTKAAQVHFDYVEELLLDFLNYGQELEGEAYLTEMNNLGNYLQQYADNIQDNSSARNAIFAMGAGIKMAAGWGIERIGI